MSEDLTSAGTYIKNSFGPYGKGTQCAINNIVRDCEFRSIKIMRYW